MKSEDYKPGSLEESKAAFRRLHRKVHHNIKNLALILDELHRVSFLTTEKCNGIKMEVQKKKDLLCNNFLCSYITFVPQFIPHPLPHFLVVHHVPHFESQMM